MSCQNCCSRRSFLGTIALGAAALSVAGTACSGTSAGAAPASVGDVSAGNIKDIPVGTLRAVSGLAVAIGRDAAGLYAMTLTCTHQGANMAKEGSVSASAVVCSRHQSRFDANGAVIQGPATEPLVHFAVDADSSGNVTIHGDTQVSAQTRVAVAT